MRHYPNVSVRFKEEGFDVGSVVTDADMESERKIIDILSENFPEHAIYGEETGMRGEEGEYTWYIDPLDGTSNFTRHIPLWGISIGLVKNGEPVLGVLKFPALDILVFAEKGKGCSANGKTGQVSPRPIEKSLYYSGGKFGGKGMQFKKTLAEKSGFVKIIDASSYELAQIAMGEAEIYYLANVPHDVVAGISIVRESGGMVTDGEGNPWRIDSRDILATNGVCHADALAALHEREL